jgi:MFS family permease
VTGRRGLGPRAWRVLTASGLSQLGSGLTHPFLVIYLNHVAGVSISATGIVLGVSGVGGLAGSGLAGVLADRIGTGRALVVMLTVGALGTGDFAIAHGVLGSSVAAFAYGAGIAGIWTALTPLLAATVPADQQGRVLGTNYWVSSVGFGIGSLFWALLLNDQSATAYRAVFVADAASFLAFAGILLLTGETWHAVASPAPREEQLPARDTGRSRRILIMVTAVNTLLVTAALSQLNAAFPAFAIGPAGVSTGLVGAAMVVNSVTIVVAGLVLNRRLDRYSRTTLAGAACALFALTWLVVLVAGADPGGRIAAGCLIGAPAIYALGEVLLAPSFSTLVNSLPPQALRGRYNAVFNLSWQFGSIAGPALSTAFIGRGLGAPLLLGLAGGCLVCAIATVPIGRCVPKHFNNVQSQLALE